jgi:electron transport complex protein RnfC
VVRPTNVLAPIGASLGELIDFAGGLTGDTERVVAGGPMMGFAVGSLDTPVTKGTSGVLALTAGELGEARETSCVRCGRCVDVCPLHLVPTKMALAARHKDWELARRYQITACCECGCCAYTCPAAIPLTQLIRMGKAQMPRD